MSSPSPSAERRRDFRPAAMALACVVFLGGILAWQIETAQREERAQTLAKCRDLLLRCREIAEDYWKARQTERERRQTETEQAVAKLADDVQVMIQASLAAAARSREEYPLLTLARLWGWSPPNTLASDWAETALLTASVELAQHLPPAATIQIFQEKRLLLRLAGKEPPEPARSLAASRLMEFDCYGQTRRWLLTVAMAPPPTPMPTSAEMADFLGQRLGLPEASEDSWRGVIIDAEGMVMEVFPAFAPGPRVMPLPPRSGQWVAMGDTARPRLTRLDRIALAGAPWHVGIQVAIDAPSLFAAMRRTIADDWRWAGLLGFSTFAFGISLLTALLSPRRIPPPQPTVPPRIVPKADGARVRPGEVTFAEIVAEAGGANLMVRELAIQRQGAPGDSLRRLQHLHRGSPVLGGTRILDHARSPLLRELVKKVRPARGGERRNRLAAAEVESACTKNTGR